jgi:hypothetical protein
MAAEGDEEANATCPVGTLPLDPWTGGLISPIVAAALCIKPRGLLTRRQAKKVDVLKQTLPIFACMRSLAMRFRGLLRGSDPKPLDDWIRDAMRCGIHAMQKFAAKLRHWASGDPTWAGLNPSASRSRRAALWTAASVVLSGLSTFVSATSN